MPRKNDFILWVEVLSSGGPAVFTSADTVSVTDSATLQADASFQSADTVSVTDNADLSAGASFASADTVSVADTADLSANAGFKSSDTVSVTETADLSAESSFASSDTVSVTDTADLSASAAFKAADTVSVTDSATLSVSGSVSFAAADNISVTDSASLEVYSPPIDIYIDYMRFVGGSFVNICRGTAAGPAPGYLKMNPGRFNVKVRWSSTDQIFVPPYTQATLYAGNVGVPLSYLNDGIFTGSLNTAPKGNILIWLSLSTGGSGSQHITMQYPVFNAGG